MASFGPSFFGTRCLDQLVASVTSKSKQGELGTSYVGVFCREESETKEGVSFFEGCVRLLNDCSDDAEATLKSSSSAKESVSGCLKIGATGS